MNKLEHVMVTAQVYRPVDADDVIYVDTTDNNVQIHLPAFQTRYDGRILYVKHVAGTNQCLVSGMGWTIDDEQEWILTLGTSLTLQQTMLAWRVL